MIDNQSIERILLSDFFCPLSLFLSLSVYPSKIKKVKSNHLRSDFHHHFYHDSWLFYWLSSFILIIGVLMLFLSLSSLISLNLSNLGLICSLSSSSESIYCTFLLVCWSKCILASLTNSLICVGGYCCSLEVWVECFILAIILMCFICSPFYFKDLSLILMILSISSNLSSRLEAVLVGILVLLKIDNSVLSI